MQFNSNLFIFFFLPVLLLVHGLLKNNKQRNMWLLLTSCLFFCWASTESFLFILLYGLFNYWMARTLAAHPKKPLLALAIIADVAVLFVFKYLNFSLGIAGRVLGINSPTVQLFQPMGISFVTFTMIAYVVDVYKGIAPVLTNPVDFFLYLTFFAKAGQGPIIRHGDMIPALTDRVCTRADFFAGLHRFIRGFGKKVLIADILGNTVDIIFGALTGAESQNPCRPWCR